jgi:hypothetical protein
VPGSSGGAIPPPPVTSDRGSYAQFLPDPRMTPGDTLDVTKDDICVPGYARKVRNVPQAVKEQAYREYGITHREPGEYEVDHLISLELGGSNSPKNLWPQSFRTKPWNARVKDALENRLHVEVCAGRVDLQTAQQEIATDWIAAYRKYFRTQMPVSGKGGRDTARGREDEAETMAGGAAPAAAPNGQVWVNTRSGAYWRPGTQYYGKTKEGKYMSEADAIREGYHAAGKGR